MKSRVRWLQLFFMLLLSILGGALNVASILELSQATSHHSGNTSHLAISLIQGDLTRVRILAGVILAYFLGAMVSGILSPSQVFYRKASYGFLLAGIGGLLLFFYYTMSGQWYFPISIAFLLGVQNGLFLFYHRTLVRTTHVTGTISDAGFALGQLIKGKKDYQGRFLFYCVNWFAFFLGGLLSASLITHTDIQIFLLISGCYFLVSLYFFYLRQVYIKLGRSYLCK